MNGDFYNNEIDAKTRRENLRRAAERERLAEQARPQSSTIKQIRRVITAAGSFVFVNGQRIAEDNAPIAQPRTSTQELVALRD